jgi:hypothetical protein
MNYNELPDREIDMLVATRAAGWQLDDRVAYSLSGGKWSRTQWDDGTERWLPYYTKSFDDTIEAARYLLSTKAHVIELLINSMNLTFNAQIGRFVLEATPRSLCILMLEAMDAAANTTEGDQ